MAFCIFLWLPENSGFFPIQFDKLSGKWALQYQQGPVVLQLVVVVTELVYSDQPVQDPELEFEQQELEWEFDLQGPEPDFDLQTLKWVLNCRTLSLICRTLHCIYDLILSIWISWIRGIWSIHPDLNISELFLTLNVSIFHVFIKFCILLLYQ